MRKFIKTLSQEKWLDKYQSLAKKTYRIESSGEEKLRYLSLGLVSEAASLLNYFKKIHRNQSSIDIYQQLAYDEFGDVLWYFSNICSELNIRLADLDVNGKYIQWERGNEITSIAAGFEHDNEILDTDLVILSLCVASFAATIISVNVGRDELNLQARKVWTQLHECASSAKVDGPSAAMSNLHKVYSRWPVRGQRNYGILYDSGSPAYEQLPRVLEVQFIERNIRGKIFCYQMCRGIPLGDRLTDNATHEDDYRFHDVFHLAYAAILGWSPVLRGLLRLKRKSDPQKDEVEDGARAAIVEEGIANWIFLQGRRFNWFEGVKSLDFDLLMSVKEMTSGYEVHDRPYWMWEEAIFEGFRVFRELKANRGGTVTIDLNERCIRYAPPTWSD